MLQVKSGWVRMQFGRSNIRFSDCNKNYINELFCGVIGPYGKVDKAKNLSPKKARKRLEKHIRANNWNIATVYLHVKKIIGLFSLFKQEIVQELWAALQASITNRDAAVEEICDAISEGEEANNSLVEGGADTKINVFAASDETNTPNNNERLV